MADVLNDRIDPSQKARNYAEVAVSMYWQLLVSPKGVDVQALADHCRYSLLKLDPLFNQVDSFEEIALEVAVMAEDGDIEPMFREWPTHWDREVPGVSE